MKNHEFNPNNHYRLNYVNENHVMVNDLIYFTRGQFNKCLTGSFVGYSHSIDKTKVQILLNGCEKCESSPIWVSVAEFESAECVINCEYCDNELKPAGE